MLVISRPGRVRGTGWGGQEALDLARSGEGITKIGRQEKEPQ